MRSTLSELTVDQINIQRAAQRNLITITIGKKLFMDFGLNFNLILAEAHKWTKNGLCFDGSLWQTGKDKKTTSIRWDLLHHPLFHGGYCKFGEPWANYTPGSDLSAKWLDPSWPSNRAALTKEGLLKIPYIYNDLAWTRNRGMTDQDVKNLFKGSILQIANNLLTVPDIWLACQALKDFTGQTFTAEQLKNDPDADVDGIVHDVEKYWMSNNAEIGDFWMGMCLDTTTRGLEFLAEHQFIPEEPILKQTCYGSNWMIQEHGPLYLRQVMDRYDSIVAGYYWRETDIKFCETMDDLIALLDTISQSWEPVSVGASTPGKVRLANQLAANITMSQVTNPVGGASAIDVNSFHISKEALYARYPKYAARRLAWEGGITPPPPPPPPPPEPMKKYWATIKPTTISLKLRSRADAGSTVLQTNLKFLAPVEVSLVDPSTVPDPAIVWAKAEVYFAVSNKKDTTSVQPYVDLVEE